MAITKSTDGQVRDLLSERVFASPLYFLQGEEPYFIDEVIDRLQAVIPVAERGFNLTVLFGRDVDMATVLADARQFPFMGQRRVLIVKEAQMMDSLVRGDDGPNRLITYLSHLQTTTTLVFCFKGKTLDGRKPLVGKLKSAGFLFTSPKLSEWDSKGLEAIVRDLCKQAGVKTDRGAENMLMQLVGTDLSRLANEIAKLKVAVPEGVTVTEDSVLTFIGLSRDFSIFELQKALAQRDFTTAVKLARHFANNEKEHHILKELAFLTTFFSRILVLKAYKIKNNRLPDATGLGYRINQDLERAINAYALGQLVAIIHLLAEADRMAKGAGTLPMETKEIWPWLIFRIFES